MQWPGVVAGGTGGDLKFNLLDSVIGADADTFDV
jgi:hypothetical protein